MHPLSHSQNESSLIHWPQKPVEAEGKLTHLHARQSFRLISAFSNAFFDGSEDGPARAVEYVETS